MFRNIYSVGQPSPSKDKSSLRTIYSTFQNLLGRGTEASEEMDRDSRSVEETFMTPVSSTGNLLGLSPEIVQQEDEVNDTVDLLTGEHMDTMYDTTMQDSPNADELFMDPNSIEYLVKRAETNRNRSFVVDGGKESLYVKFDPLYSQHRPRHSQTFCATNDNDIGYETGSTASVVTDNLLDSPKRTISTDSMGFKDKPTQRVRPALKKDKSIIQTVSTPALVRSVSAILTPTRVAVDRLINIHGNTPPVPQTSSHYGHSVHNFQHTDHLHSLKAIIQKQDQDMVHLHQENRELKYLLRESNRKQEEQETKIRKLTEDKERLLEKEADLLQQINEKVLSNKQMSIVMTEYEKTLASMIGEQQKEKLHKQEFENQLQEERDEALKHLANMESSFNDLISKYEKCKGIVAESKDREKKLMEKIAEYEEGMKKNEHLYAKLKEVSTESLDKANETLENITKNHSVEIAKLNATIKKHELTISSLQESLTQKNRDNEELTRICDQLINAVN